MEWIGLTPPVVTPVSTNTIMVPYSPKGWRASIAIERTCHVLMLCSKTLPECKRLTAYTERKPVKPICPSGPFVLMAESIGERESLGADRRKSLAKA